MLAMHRTAVKTLPFSLSTPPVDTNPRHANRLPSQCFPPLILLASPQSSIQADQHARELQSASERLQGAEAEAQAARQEARE
eukprot:scaffold72854_cov24-Prasinocladus_malaysianus.AAC.1